MSMSDRPHDPVALRIMAVVAERYADPVFADQFGCLRCLDAAFFAVDAHFRRTGRVAAGDDLKRRTPADFSVRITSSTRSIESSM